MIELRRDSANQLMILMISEAYTPADLHWSIERFLSADYDVDCDRLSLFDAAAAKRIEITPADLVDLTLAINKSLQRRTRPGRARGAVVIPGGTDHPLASAFPVFNANDPEARVEQRPFETLEEALAWLGLPAEYDPAVSEHLARRV